MLQRNSAKVQTCLTSAARSRERAAVASDPELRRFFFRMELSWLRLAASIAHVERTDLFLHDCPRSGATAGRCLHCEGPARLKLVDVSKDSEHHTFECLHCGLEQVHSAVH